jgi:hypothetical protein
MKMYVRPGFIITLSGALIVIIAAFFSWPGDAALRMRGVQTRNLSNARQIATACKLYAQNHEGHFPIHLSELEPNYVSRGALSRLGCAREEPDDELDHPMNWFYFGAGFDDKNPPQLLIASPQGALTRRIQKRVTIKGDMSWQIVNEDDYERLFGQTVKQMEALQESRKPQPSTPAPDPQPAH